MIYFPRLTVVLDTYVIYPASIGGVLMSLAAEGLFIAKRPGIIQVQWLRNLLEQLG